MLDRDGYRPNVGIILCNRRNEVFWGKRIHDHAWQFPQGGIDHGESPMCAMYRELQEELGLRPAHVRVLGRTRDWLRYQVPEPWLRRDSRLYKGQKQIWFLLRFVGRDWEVRLRSTPIKPEFRAWRWIDYWSALETVIEFKRAVYEQALNELASYLALSRKSAASRFSAESTRAHQS